MKYAMIVIGLIVVVVFSLCTTLIVYSFQVKDGTEIDMQGVQQISKDWSITPFAQITLRTGSCTANEEPVFGVNWKGTELGCSHVTPVEEWV
jgi:hypothetical protein